MRPGRLLEPWGYSVLSAALLEVPFPFAGPMAPWRAIFAFFALAPLLHALLCPRAGAGRPLGRNFLVGYLCGILWYAGNCYWIYATMNRYGGVPAAGAAGMVLLYSMVLGLYFAVFAWAVTLLARLSGGVGMALLAAPFLWVGLDLLAAHLTSVPWDQLGYSQVDNAAFTSIAPWLGTYGLTFVLVAVSSALAAATLLGPGRARLAAAASGLAAMLALQLAGSYSPPPEPVSARAVLIQPNLDVGEPGTFAGSGWRSNLAAMEQEYDRTCTPYLRGLPETGLPLLAPPDCSRRIDLFAWPEAPSPVRDIDPRFRQTVGMLARRAGSTAIVGSIGVDAAAGGEFRIYNSASLFTPQGNLLGRYDKIHLVPFGEFVPYRDLLFFAHHLTQNVSDFSRGEMRKVFRSGGHRYGIFICYESIFADEVRQFAAAGAEVFVNLSDDGWYGDTSAPWQHLNMARMRAIENRRWLVRDTNDGVTAIVDPWGRVTASIPRHTAGTLNAPYGFRDQVTFYSRHGDVFAMLCAILSLGFLGHGLRQAVGRRYPNLRKSGIARQ